MILQRAWEGPNTKIPSAEGPAALRPTEQKSELRNQINKLQGRLGQPGSRSPGARGVGAARCRSPGRTQEMKVC